MPYATGPYSLHSSLPSPARPEIHSSRSINFASKRYELDATTGGNDPMTDTAQRVALLLTFGVEMPRFVSEQHLEQLRTDARTALVDLTDGPRPDISLVSVTAERTYPGTASLVVQYRNLGTGKNETVQLP